MSHDFKRQRNLCMLAEREVDENGLGINNGVIEVAVNLENGYYPKTLSEWWAAGE